MRGNGAAGLIGVGLLALAAMVAGQAGCDARPLEFPDGLGGAPGSGTGGRRLGGNSSGGQSGATGGRAGTGGSADGGGSGSGGAPYIYGTGGAGIGGAAAGDAGTGGAGVGGAGGIVCDSVCASGEMCGDGVCFGSSSRWSTLGGDVHHSGFNVNETGKPPLTPAWTVPLGSWPLWPAVSDGTTVYVSQKGSFSAVSMMALAPADGHILWSYNFGDVFGVGQVTVDGGRVYVAQCNNYQGSYMHSLVASTGKLLWSQPIGAQWENYWAPLVIPGGRISFDAGEFGGLYGLDTASGAELFFNGALEQYDEWSPLLLEGQLYTFLEGHLRTHDLQSGVIASTVSVPWSWDGWSMTTAPVSDGDQIYIIAPPSLYAWRPGRSVPEWTASGAYTGMPAVANGVVYSISGGQLRANDAGTGAVLWSFAGDGQLGYPPVVAGGFVYVASDNIAYAVEIDTQQPVWKGVPGGWLSIAGGQLYVAQVNGALAAYALMR
jgi:hypothetical protein